MNAIEHLLTCLAEEGSKVAQAACKAGRFGITDSHADRKFLPNNEYIVREINDLLGVVERRCSQLGQAYGNRARAVISHLLIVPASINAVMSAEIRINA